MRVDWKDVIVWILGILAIMLIVAAYFRGEFG